MKSAPAGHCAEDPIGRVWPPGRECNTNPGATAVRKLPAPQEIS